MEFPPASGARKQSNRRPRFGVAKISRPPFWSGFRVVPEQIEFWTQKPYRRHHRILYTLTNDGWQTQWLYP